MISVQTQEAHHAAVTGLRRPVDLGGPGLKDEDDRELQLLEEVTLAAVKAAKDCRSRMLDDAKVSVGAPKDDANRVISANPAPDIGETADQTPEPEKYSGVAEPERQLPTAAEAIDQYQSKALELLNANVNATLDYARRLADVRSPVEFIAVSTRHACRLFELHTTAIGVLSLAAAPNGPREHLEKMARETAGTKQGVQT